MTLSVWSTGRMRDNMTPEELAAEAKMVYDSWESGRQAEFLLIVQAGVADDTRPGAQLTERQVFRLQARQAFLNLLSQG